MPKFLVHELKGSGSGHSCKTLVSYHATMTYLLIMDEVQLRLVVHLFQLFPISRYYSISVLQKFQYLDHVLTQLHLVIVDDRLDHYSPIIQI